jgi:hypothetical protein
MPRSVAVRDILVHPETNDLIVATHGRSLWIFDDVAPLQQMAGKSLQGPQFFPARTAVRFSTRPTRFGFGDMTFAGSNPSYGALFSYMLETAATDVKLQIADESGTVIRTLPGSKQRGFHRLAWDLHYAGPEGQGTPGGQRGRGSVQGPQALPGSYTARLTVDGNSYEQKLNVVLDPTLHVSDSDLRTQFETARELRDMQSSVNSALARLRAAATGESKRVEDLLTRPAHLRSETGPRLKENLEGLANMVDGVNAAPTQAQMQYFERLKAEFQDAMRQVDAVYSRPANRRSN